MRSLPLTLTLTLICGPAFADPPVISAANAVLAEMAHSIAGDDATITVVVPNGTDPATFSPDIRQIAAIQGADLIILNGAGYEPWATRVSLPRARTVDTTAAFPDDLIHIAGLTHSHGTGPAHSHDGSAPIVWMDFTLAGRQAESIASGLTRQFPDNATLYAANLVPLEQRLSELDEQARALGSALEGRTVLVAHPGFEYFSRAYSIPLRETTFDATVAATPDQLQALDAALADDASRIMLWNASPPADTAAALAARNVTAVVLPNGVQTPEGQDPLDLIANGLAGLASAVTR